MSIAKRKCTNATTTKHARAMKRKLQIQEFFFHVVVNWDKQKKKTQDLWNDRLDFHHC
jgi:hypothetical protein